MLRGGRELQRCLYAYAVKELLGGNPGIDAGLLYPSATPGMPEAGRYDTLHDPDGTLDRLTEALAAAADNLRNGLALPGVAAGARILGVNVRNLKTLDVDPARYAALADGLPEDVVRVAESGVESEEQIKAYAAAGADVVLVGEALVRHGAPEEALRAFRAASLTVR